MTNRSGSILIVTLWLVAILATLSVAISHHLSVELRLVKYRIEQAQAQALARGGIRYGMTLLQKEQEEEQQQVPPVDVDWLRDEWALNPQAITEEEGDASLITLRFTTEDNPSKGATVTIKVVDEERKLNLNTAEEHQLTGLGLPPESALAIIDYRDEDAVGNFERDPPRYQAKNGQIKTLEELREIPGIRDEQLLLLRETASVSREDSTKLNINTASHQALMAIGLSDSLEKILTFRDQGHYFVSLIPDVKAETPLEPVPELGTDFQNARDLLGVSSNTFTVMAVGSVTSLAVQHRVEAVIGRSNETGKQSILAWKES